jgi:hypothetical protein
MLSAAQGRGSDKQLGFEGSHKDDRRRVKDCQENIGTEDRILDQEKALKLNEFDINSGYSACSCPELDGIN